MFPTAVRTSGTYNFNPSGGEIILTAFDRIVVRPSEIAAAQMQHEAKLKVFEANQPEDQGKLKAQQDIATMNAHVQSTLENERIASEERQAMMNKAFEEWKAELENQTKLAIAQLQSKTTLKTARLAAKAKKEAPASPAQ